jgi:hypothetical protein
MGFFMLLILAITQVNPESKNAEIELKAEFIITMTWPDESKDDVDLFVKMPNGDTVSFRNKSMAFAELDRDDLGERSDKVRMPGGETMIIKENFEHVTIRRSMSGKYVVNALMYHKLDNAPTKVKIKVEQLNPYKLILVRDLILTDNREEETGGRFFIKNGRVVNADFISESVVPYESEGP